MNNNFKSWHGWLLFGVSMTVVFVWDLLFLHCLNAGQKW